MKSRVANFSQKEGTLVFGLFCLWEETGYVWDVVTVTKKALVTANILQNKKSILQLFRILTSK